MVNVLLLNYNEVSYGSVAQLVRVFDLSIERFWVRTPVLPAPYTMDDPFFGFTTVLLYLTYQDQFLFRRCIFRFFSSQGGSCGGSYFEIEEEPNRRSSGV